MKVDFTAMLSLILFQHLPRKVPETYPNITSFEIELRKFWSLKKVKKTPEQDCSNFVGNKMPASSSNANISLVELVSMRCHLQSG